MAISRYSKPLTTLFAGAVLLTATAGGFVAYGRGFPTKGLTETALVATPCTEFSGSVNIRVDTDKPWLCDLGNGTVIGIIPWDSKASADYWDYTTEYRVYRLENASDSLGAQDPSDLAIRRSFYDIDILKDLKPVFSTKEVSRRSVTALRLQQSDRDLSITVGGGKKLRLPWPEQWPMLERCSTLRVFSCDRKNLPSVTDRLEAYPEAETYTGIDEFVPPVLKPDMTDDRTGYWTYLDRVTPKSGRTVVGGRYRLAIVQDPDEDGTLLLVYISGAEINKDLWTKGDIKGRLRPTSFENHYDLEWLDSHRKPAGMNECSATFEGINLLTLDFPLAGAQIRLQREMKAE